MPRASPQGCIQPQFAGNITLAGDWRRQTHLHTSHGPRGCCRGGLPLLIVVFQPSVCLFSPISPNHRRRDGTPEGRLPLGWRTGIHRFPDKSGATQSGIKPAAVYAFTRATTRVRPAQGDGRAGVLAPARAPRAEPFPAPRASPDFSHPFRQPGTGSCVINDAAPRVARARWFSAWGRFWAQPHAKRLNAWGRGILAGDGTLVRGGGLACRGAERLEGRLKLRLPCVR